MRIRNHNFASSESLCEALRNDLIDRFRLEINLGKRPVWAVSGGSSPAALFSSLHNVEFPWKNVDICQVDERWVPPHHPRSNETFIHEQLLQGHVKSAKFHPMYQGGLSYDEAEQVVEEKYSHIQRPFTSVLLGMGVDGHTASLFPEAEGLERAFNLADERYCAAVKAKKSNVTGEELERMTLTAKAITDAKHVTLLLIGQEKLNVFQAALEDPQKPITRIVKLLKNPLNVYFAP